MTVAIREVDLYRIDIMKWLLAADIRQSQCTAPRHYPKAIKQKEAPHIRRDHLQNEITVFTNGVQLNSFRHELPSMFSAI